MHDVIVIGAGPAGLHAARLLSERGLDVIVLEEHEAVGRPVHCTGILAREAFDEFGLARDTILNPLTAARFVSPGRARFHLSPGSVEAVVVDRVVFDARLAERAVGAGARILCGARVRTIKCDADFVSVDTSVGSALRARACVLACGGRYALHRQLALHPPAMLLHTAQAELPAARPGDVEVHFGAEIAPKGFAWVVPVSRGDRDVRAGWRHVRQRGAALLQAHGRSHLGALGHLLSRRRLNRCRRSCRSLPLPAPTETGCSWSVMRRDW